MNFLIELQEQKVKPHQVTALHLMVAFALLASGAFLVSALQAMSVMPFSWRPIRKDEVINMHSVLLPAYIMVGLGLLLFIVSVFRNRWLLRPANNKLFRIIEMLVCLVIAIYSAVNAAWVLTGIFGLLCATVLFAFNAEKNQYGSFAVRIDADGIQLPFIARRRTLKWTEVDAVLLRHGTLTVSCADNSLYQWITRAGNVDTDSLEAYCSAEIEAARSQRQKDW